MSELIYVMTCPRCNKLVDMMFSGSGRDGICMNCGYHLGKDSYYLDYEGYVISYNG